MPTSSSARVKPRRPVILGLLVEWVVARFGALQDERIRFEDRVERGDDDSHLPQIRRQGVHRDLTRVRQGRLVESDRSGLRLERIERQRRELVHLLGQDRVSGTTARRAPRAMRIGLRSRAAALLASDRSCATTIAAWLTRACVVIREIVGNVIAVATPRMASTMDSSSSVKPAALRGVAIPSPFRPPGKANGLAPVHAGGE